MSPQFLAAMEILSVYHCEKGIREAHDAEKQGGTACRERGWTELALGRRPPPTPPDWRVSVALCDKTTRILCIASPPPPWGLSLKKMIFNLFSITLCVLRGMGEHSVEAGVGITTHLWTFEDNSVDLGLSTGMWVLGSEHSRLGCRASTFTC